ncbi:DUF2971 domain-containing protein [Pseudoduganella aquatica]|uniref:DUF2971 domain-containing protein n=1 Tax=Pseudoduganella aquatica TaxID=2660641 RepID=UPI001E455F7A|nr:DUF2971 domain-containing protein [Pseudoduganella aquatica]
MTTNEGGEHFLYRFRSVDNLLGKRQELLQQQIYFASPDQLNDPLEGHINLYWKGDAIIWRNFFKNYLACTVDAFAFWATHKRARPITWQDIPVQNPYLSGRSAVHDELETLFFGNPTISVLLDRIASTERNIGRNEVTVHLRSVHYFVIMTIFDIVRQVHERTNQGRIFDPAPGIKAELLRVQSAIDLFDILERTHAHSHGSIEAEYANVLSKHQEADLLNYYTEQIDFSDANRVFIFNDFCFAYVRRLGALMYPPWYAACFMESCDAPSMWAYYGSNHSGICLKFRTDTDANGRFINLNTTTSFDMNGSQRTMRPHYFKPVVYRADHATLNFFETLGAAPTPVLNAQWYTNEKKEVSPLLLRTEEERKKWRDEYWKQFLVSATTKTETWKPEQEQRLVYHSMSADLTPEDRTLSYDFSSLEAIIFGVRVAAADKLKVMRVIAEKCRDHNRSDFNFFQAQFTTNQNEIKLSEMEALPIILKTSRV